MQIELTTFYLWMKRLRHSLPFEIDGYKLCCKKRLLDETSRLQYLLLMGVSKWYESGRAECIVHCCKCPTFRDASTLCNFFSSSRSGQTWDLCLLYNFHAFWRKKEILTCFLPLLQKSCMMSSIEPHFSHKILFWIIESKFDAGSWGNTSIKRQIHREEFTVELYHWS